MVSVIARRDLDAQQLLNFSQRVFARLLVLYPRQYRQEYGPHMAQLFKDCSREAVSQNGSAALLALWISTLFDLLKTAFEENFKELNFMSKEKFVRLGGWALMLGPVLFVLTLFVGSLEVSYYDPLGGREAAIEYLMLVLAPIAMLCFSVGALALRSRYGPQAGPAASNALAFSAFCAAVSTIGAVGLRLLIPGEWWALTFGPLLFYLLGLAMFSWICIQRGVLPKWNWLFFVTAIGFPIIVLSSLGLIFQLPQTILSAIMLLTLLGLMVVGFKLQRA
jgi:hypothetical protein